MKTLWDRLGGAIAVIMTIIYGVLITNQMFHYIANPYILKILTEAVTYGGVALVIVCTFEMTTKWPFIFKLAIFAIWTLIVVYTISPTFFGLWTV